MTKKSSIRRRQVYSIGSLFRRITDGEKRGGCFGSGLAARYPAHQDRKSASLDASSAPAWALSRSTVACSSLWLYHIRWAFFDDVLAQDAPAGATLDDRLGMERTSLKITSWFVIVHAFLTVPLVQGGVKGHEGSAVGARFVDLLWDIDLPRGYLAPGDLAPRYVRRGAVVAIVGH